MSDTLVIPGGPGPATPNAWHPRMLGECFPGMPLYAPAAGEVAPARANAIGTSRCVGLGLTRAESGERVFTQYIGPLTLTVEEWALITGNVLGLNTGNSYYVSHVTAGRLVEDQSGVGGNFNSLVGVASTPTTMILQLSLATPT